jgi:hypothetical protein
MVAFAGRPKNTRPAVSVCPENASPSDTNARAASSDGAVYRPTVNRRAQFTKPTEAG